MKKIMMILAVFLWVAMAASALAEESKAGVATNDLYFDVATGHKYMKNSDGTYREYSRKGKLIRSALSNDVPLLTTNKYIREVSEDAYLLYEKSRSSGKKIVVLPYNEKHPDGWRCEKILVSMQ